MEVSAQHTLLSEILPAASNTLSTQTSEFSLFLLLEDCFSVKRFRAVSENQTFSGQRSKIQASEFQSRLLQMCVRKQTD